MSRKYFQIGFNKCGTSSIARFFAKNGIPCVHWDQGQLAKRMHHNLQEGQFILSGYEHYDAFTDMEHATAHEIFDSYKYYMQIFEQVEDAMFILNTRDRDSWIKSRLSHRIYSSGEFYVEVYKSIYRLDDVSAVVELWKKDWDGHHAAVRELIPPEKLLVFNIDTDSSVRLCEFVGLDVSAAQHYTHQNLTLTDFGKFLRRRTPERIRHGTPRKIKDSIKWLFRKHR